MPRPVKMALELDPVLAELGQLRQAHHLIAAAVGQDRTVPVHECVQTAQPRHPLRTGAQHQMIGVAENDIGASRAHRFRLHRLDRSRGAYRHERRRANIAPLHMNGAGSRFAVGRGDREGKALSHANARSSLRDQILRPRFCLFPVIV